MWQILLTINSALVVFSTIFLIYAAGAALILGEWKQLLVAFLIELFLLLTELVISAIIQS
jgi:hypothetical protein